MFQRKPIREDLLKEILARTTDGRLPAGRRINETHLSRDLGISRTPLRETMLGLEALGFLTSAMGQGFMVPALDSAEFVAIQTVLARLKPLALELSFPLAPKQVMEIQNLLNRARVKATGTGPQTDPAVVDLESRFAQLVLGACPNPVLKADIGRLDGLARRYWYAACAQGFDPAAWFKSHERMYELVRTDDRAAAASHWQDHLERFCAEAARFLPANADRE